MGFFESLSNIPKINEGKFENLNITKLLDDIKYKRSTPSQEKVVEMTKNFREYNLPTDYVSAILMYLNIQSLSPNSINARHINSQLNYSTIEKKILGSLYIEAPSTNNEIIVLKNILKMEGYNGIDVEIACCHYILDYYGALETLPSSKNIKSKIDEFKENANPENLIAISMLVNELDENYLKLLTIDKDFLSDIVKKRPLIALMFLTKQDLRNLIIKKYHDELLKYINNEEIYKLLVPFVHIHQGKTHGQWRHLVDPKKQCLILKSDNCKIASSKNTQKSYDKSETEGEFLVIQGLSIQADSDNAEVHYLEV